MEIYYLIKMKCKPASNDEFILLNKFQYSYYVGFAKRNEASLFTKDAAEKFVDLYSNKLALDKSCIVKTSRKDKQTNVIEINDVSDNVIPDFMYIISRSWKDLEGTEHTAYYSLYNMKKPNEVCYQTGLHDALKLFCRKDAEYIIRWWIEKHKNIDEGKKKFISEKFYVCKVQSIVFGPNALYTIPHSFFTKHIASVDKKYNEEKMVDKRSWEEFRGAGMVYIANIILQLFGWSLQVTIDDDEIVNVNPVRTKYRGFDEQSVERNMRKVYSALDTEDLERDLDF